MYMYILSYPIFNIPHNKVAAMAQSIRLFASHAEGWVFKSLSLVVKTGHGRSTKRSTTCVSVDTVMWHAKEPSLLNEHECPV